MGGQSVITSVVNRHGLPHPGLSVSAALKYIVLLINAPFKIIIWMVNSKAIDKPINTHKFLKIY